MKKARSNVVGVKSPEKRSASIARRRSATPGKRAAGSRASARRSSSSSGFGRGTASPAVVVILASPRPSSGSEPSGARPVSASSITRPSAYTSDRVSPGSPGELLRRQVASLLDGQEVGPAQGRPQAQSLELHLPVERHHEPRGRDEAVDEGGARVVLLPVQGLERRRGTARDHERVLGGEREDVPAAALEDGGDRASLHELGRHVEGLLHPSDAEHAHEARALQPRGEARLFHEAPGRLGVRRHLGPEPEDGDEAVEAGGAEPGSPVLAAEGARFRLIEEDEPAELLAEGHGSRRRMPRTIAQVDRGHRRAARLGKDQGLLAPVRAADADALVVHRQHRDARGGLARAGQHDLAVRGEGGHQRGRPGSRGRRGAGPEAPASPRLLRPPVAPRAAPAPRDARRRRSGRDRGSPPDRPREARARSPRPAAAARGGRRRALPAGGPARARGPAPRGPRRRAPRGGPATSRARPWLLKASTSIRSLPAGGHRGEPRARAGRRTKGRPAVRPRAAGPPARPSAASRPRAATPAASRLGADAHGPERQPLGRPQERQAQRPRRGRVSGGRAPGGRPPLEPDRLRAQPLALLPAAREPVTCLVALAPGGQGHAEVQPERGGQEDGRGDAAPHGPPPTHRARTTLRTSASRASGPGSTSRSQGPRSSRSSSRSHDAASRATTCISRTPSWA